MAEPCDLALVGGTIVTPGGIIDGGVAVRAGRITASAVRATSPRAAGTIELRGRVLLPGVIDPEVSLGSHRPLASDVESETRAAAATGVTTWGLQLNSAMMAPPPGGIQAPDQIPRMADAVPHLLATESLATVDFFLSPIITTDAQVAEFPLLAREYGITSFKFHLQMAGPWGQQRVGRSRLTTSTTARSSPPARPSPRLGRRPRAVPLRELANRAAAAAAAPGGGPHRHGRRDDHSPWLTEAAHARAYLYFCEVTGCPAYVVHCTTEQTIAEVQPRPPGGGGRLRAGRRPLPRARQGRLAHQRAVARSRTHAALWRALASGEIDCVGSDHVAHNLAGGDGDRQRLDHHQRFSVPAWRDSCPMLLSEGVNAGRSPWSGWRRWPARPPPASSGSTRAKASSR